MGMAASAKVEALADFYSGPVTGFLNPALLPMAPFIVLGAGYVREWMYSVVGHGDGRPLAN